MDAENIRRSVKTEFSRKGEQKLTGLPNNAVFFRTVERTGIPVIVWHVWRLEKLGALEWEKIVHGNQAWRLITCIWLHASVIHLLANMLSLVFIRIRLEQQFGFVRVGVIYLLSGIGGSVLSSLFIQNNISVGASRVQ